MHIQEHVPLAPLTTFGIGGPARFFAEATSSDDVCRALAFAKERGIRFALLSGGSNVLVADEGYDGLVIRITGTEHHFEQEVLHAEAGCNLLSLIREASSLGIGGWEKLAGIPGTIGGAVRGNAGAFGSEIKDFVLDVRAVSSETLATHTFSVGECDFSYRHSVFKDEPQWIVLSVRAQLMACEEAESAARVENTIAERERRHLQNVRAAGSYFMNPVAPPDIVRQFEDEKGVQAREGRVPAGWLIERAGMKGVRVGGALASMQHPNYIVNEGSATAREVRELAKRIIDAVARTSGVTLQEEAAYLA